MASKKISKGKGQGQDIGFTTGTRHYMPVSLSTLVRQPLGSLVMAMPTKAASGKRREFILALLAQAGPQGITWGQIREDLIAAFGSAPKKRSALYGVLAGIVYHKSTGAKGIVTYHLGRATKKGSSKSK